MPRLTRPSIKQLKWSRIAAKTGDSVEAVMEVYDVKNRHVAHSISHENLSKPDTRALVIAELNKQGATLDKIVSVLDEATTAKQPITFEGKVTDEYPDYTARIRAARTLAELHDAFPSKKTENRSVQLDIHGQFSSDEIKELLK